MSVFEIAPTPNPNALKIEVATGSLTDAPFEAYASIGEAATSELAYALFEIAGVANVFLVPQFVTVTKRADADWNDLLPSIERVLSSYLASG